MFEHSFIQVTHGLGLGEEADFGALNCQHTTKFDTKHKA